MLDLIRGPARRVRHVAAVHQPQPGGDREDVRPRRRALRRRAGRGGPGHGGLREPAPPVHGRAAALDPAPRGRAGHGRRGRAPLATIPGSLPAPGSVTEGCIFADRCGLAEDRCRTEAPPMYEIGGGRGSRCHYHERAQSVPMGADRRGAAPADAAARERDAAASRSSGSARPARPSTWAARPSAACYGVDLDIGAGETVGPGRRVGQRQDDAGPRAHGAHRPRPGRRGRARRPRAVAGLAAKRTSEDQKALQIVFQNPDSALNRRHSVQRLISRSLSKLGGYSGDAAAASGCCR